MEDNKHEQLGEFGALPGAPNGPPVPIVEVLVSALEIHPLAELFPPMSEKEFEKFLEDVKEAARIIDPLWTYQGKVIDGRNRLLACKRLGIERVPTREWDGKGSLLEFVISINLRRRHLKERQRAMIAARMKPAFEEEAKRRQGWRKEPDLMVNLPQGQSVGSSRDNAANALSVSGKSVDYACRILANGIPELIAAVDACKLAVSTASNLAELPDEEQARVLAGGRDEIRKALQTVREVRKQKPKPEGVPEVPTPVADSALDQKLIERFTRGWIKLSKTEHGFRLQFNRFCVDDLWRLINDDEFEALLEQGVTMVKTKKDNAA
jgi:hypothetical protein